MISAHSLRTLWVRNEPCGQCRARSLGVEDRVHVAHGLAVLKTGELGQFDVRPLAGKVDDVLYPVGVAERLVLVQLEAGTVESFLNLALIRADHEPVDPVPLRWLLPHVENRDPLDGRHRSDVLRDVVEQRLLVLVQFVEVLLRIGDERRVFGVYG